MLFSILHQLHSNSNVFRGYPGVMETDYPAEHFIASIMLQRHCFLARANLLEAQSIAFNETYMSLYHDILARTTCFEWFSLGSVHSDAPSEQKTPLGRYELLQTAAFTPVCFSIIYKARSCKITDIAGVMHALTSLRSVGAHTYIIHCDIISTVSCGPGGSNIQLWREENMCFMN